MQLMATIFFFWGFGMVIIATTLYTAMTCYQFYQDTKKEKEEKENDA